MIYRNERIITWHYHANADDLSLTSGTAVMFSFVLFTDVYVMFKQIFNYQSHTFPYLQNY